MGGATVHMAPVDRFLTEGSIDHTAIQNIGSNSHAAIDTHIADGTIHGDVFKVGTPVDNQVGVWTGDGTIEGDSHLTFNPTTELMTIVCELNVINNNGLRLIDSNASTATDGWEFKPGQAGLHENSLILTDVPADAINNRYITHVYGNRPVYGKGIAIASNTALADESVGALAYYMPRDNVGTHRAILSYVSNSGSGQASQFSWETYVYGNSGLQLRRDAFIKTAADYTTLFQFHGDMRLYDTSDNQTNFATTDYLSLGHDGTDVYFTGANAANFNFAGASTAYNFDQKVMPGGDIASGDAAAIGYTAAEGLILTGQGSTNDVTIKNDADGEVMGVLTGTTTADFKGDVNVVGDLAPAGAVIHTIQTLAASATPSVAGGRTWLTGGTTTITDLTGGAAGQEVIILSEHAITITDGTNFFLAGSANFVMASTDSLHLIQKADGNWYEIARSVN